MHPAHSTSILLAVERDTPCTSILMLVERDTGLAVEGETLCTSILLTVERDTPCTSILLAVEMDTHCTSIMLAVEIMECRLKRKRIRGRMKMDCATKQESRQLRDAAKWVQSVRDGRKKVCRDEEKRVGKGSRKG
jgi:hypothetical protein